MATGPHVRQKTIQVDMTDVSTATTRYLISPYRGWVERIDVALHGAVTTAANAVTVSIDSVSDGAGSGTAPATFFVTIRT